MNSKFVHLLKNMPTEHQHLVTVLAYRSTAEGSSSIPLGLAKETISVLRNFCNHAEKGGKMSQKQSASACTRILVVFILKWEKKTSSHLEIKSFIYIYIYLQLKKTPKR